MKNRLLISVLSIAILVMSPMAHVATHDVMPDGTHEFVECYGCCASAAAVEVPDTFCYPQKSEVFEFPTTGVELSTHFDNYSSRAPPIR